MHGLRLGADEPSRAFRMMASSSREEALNMMPVLLESDWFPPTEEERSYLGSSTRVWCQHAHMLWSDTPYGNILESLDG